MLGLPMMALGLFVFMLETAPYQQLQQRFAWRLPGNNRVGKRPTHQFLGPDDEPVTLSGVLMPEITGGDTALALLKIMGDQGKAWPLIEGTGMIYGFFAIEGLEVTRRDFFSDGKARQIDFSLTLKRVDDTLLDTFGTVTRGLLELAR
ncbi:phage tail protein [Laribacter hongkongensis]|uniref:phage tail protein n=1 Tax=Laribacter hongkongensis TaxID=168471 RepID=UPI001EFD62D4|nr:phage tail protein [Laribacter hongkongensis]MCG9079934.1 phage tail protein [Laribacter hongkongensis]